MPALKRVTPLQGERQGLIVPTPPPSSATDREEPLSPEKFTTQVLFAPRLNPSYETSQAINPLTGSSSKGRNVEEILETSHSVPLSALQRQTMHVHRAPKTERKNSPMNPLP